MATLVEAAVGSSPWLSTRTFDCRCYAALNIADGLERLLCGSPRVGIPFFNVCEQAVANLRYGHTELCADGAAALLPVVGWSGGDNPGCFQQSLRRCQVLHPGSPRQVLGLGIDLAADEARNLLPDAIPVYGPVPVGDEPAGLLRSADQLLLRVTIPGAGTGLYGLRAQLADLVWEANTGVGG